MKKTLLKLLVLSTFLLIGNGAFALGLAPIINSFSPASGSVGTLVTITGSNMGSPTVFTIGGTTALVISNNGSTLVALVMPGATTGNILMTTAGGTGTSGSNFTVNSTQYPSLQQGSKLTGTGPLGAAQLGISAAISADGNTAVVGGSADSTNAGAAWVYIRTGLNWTQQGKKLVGSGGIGFGKQGCSVAISADGNTVLVGGKADNANAGAAWVFTRSGTTWTQQGSKLVGSGAAAGIGAQQGYAVALSADGNTALLGGYSDNVNTGAVWLFNRSGVTWTQKGSKLIGTGANGKANQGASVALSADGITAMVGGSQDSTGFGAAWVFTLSAGTWSQQGGKLVGTGGKGSPQQGFSVALSADGNTALVGGINDTTGSSTKGAVWAYTRSAGVWTQQGTKLLGPGAVGGSKLGSSISLSADGNTAIVGGYADNTNTGASWVYIRTGTAWSQQGSKLVGTGATGFAAQGSSIALSADGNTAIAGGPADNTNAGAAWIFIVCPNLNTVSLTSAAGTDAQTICVNNTTTTISYSTTGATGAAVTGLPVGDSGTWASNVLTIVGKPKTAGTYNYTVTLSGGCGTVSKTGKIIVNDSLKVTLSSAPGTDAQTRCVNAAITNIAYGTYGATGATVTGLPAGVTGNWVPNTVTISGTPTVAGVFTYTVTLTGGCGSLSTTGKITVSGGNTSTLTSAAGTDAQKPCVNTAITNITYSTTGATGGSVSGLPPGVTGTWAANVVKISGTPTGAGTFAYSINLTGGCTTAPATGSITVSTTNNVFLSSATGSDGQTACVSTPISNIVYTTSGATGATVSGLPAGVAGNWASNTLTISGTPTASGTFNYTVTLTGGCSLVTTTGTITVIPGKTVTLSSAAGTDAQTLCVNTAITNISYTTSGATGATVSGLPTGVTGSWSSNTATITGTPTASGTFNYTVTLTGGCGTLTKAGTITVSPNNTVALSSAAGTDAQSPCVNTAITNITYATTGATGASVTGLPAGITGNWSGNVETISGSTSATGSFNYTLTLTGGCGTASKTGSITIGPNGTLALSSAAGTDAQTHCVNNPITTITYTTAGASGANVYGLPAGVTGTWASNTVTISGTPTASGTFTYTITLVGACLTGTSTGTITATPDNTVVLTSAAGTDGQKLCVNNAIANIVYSTTGATGASVAGLPAGVSGSWSTNTFTIAGTPSASGTFHYAITLSGGCGSVSKVGTIRVIPSNTIALSSASGTDAQTLCADSAMTTIVYTTTGATGVTVTGLPAGVTANWSANVETISGTPTAPGTYTYTVSLMGGCGNVTLGGTLTVNPNSTVSLSSAAGTDAQTVCIGPAITPITYSSTGATSASVSGLPPGVAGNWASNTLNITGTPTTSGTYYYSAAFTGACATLTKAGVISVNICTGIAAQSGAATGVRIFPNPSRDQVYIQVDKPQEQTVFYLYNTVGQVIQTLSLTDRETVLSHTGLPSGVYLYRIVNSGRQISHGVLMFAD
jgi:hypothetical protein